MKSSLAFGADQAQTFPPTEAAAGLSRSISWRWLLAELRGERPRFVALRYGAALLAATEALVFARLLGPDEYGRYAFVIQTAAVLVFTGAGASSGYVFAFYRERDTELEGIYLAGALAQLLAGTALVTALLAIGNPDLVFSGALLLVLSPFLVAEPLLRVRSEFSVPVIGRSLGSLAALLVVAGFAAAGGGRVRFEVALAAVLAGNLAGAAAYCAWLKHPYRELFAWRRVREAIARRGWLRRYWERILRPGLPLNIATVVFLLVTYADRFFIERYRSPHDLSVYSLAWQLVQGSVLLLTSLNLVSGVRIGESMTRSVESLRSELGRQLKVTAAAGGLALFLLGAGSWLIERAVYQDYPGLLWMSLAIGAGYLAINTARAVSSVLFYARRNRELTLAHMAVLGVSMGGNVLALRLGLPYQAPAVITSAALLGLSIWLIYYTRKVARETATAAGQA